MQQEFPTIYRAKNLPEAQMLKDLLEDEGIRATITNSVLENGSGVDIVGWPTSTRVIVAEADAARARDIAVEFDNTVSGKRGMDEDDEPDSLEDRVVDAWPCCPQCGERRMTRCPACGTSGTDFLPADPNTGDLLGLPTPSAGAFSGCSCGPGGCGKRDAETAEDVSANEEDKADHPTEEPAETASSTLLLCPTCDEPFHPQYLRRCEGCGHEFPDGVEMPQHEEESREPFNRQVAIAAYVIVTFCLAAMLFSLSGMGAAIAVVFDMLAIGLILFCCHR